MKIKLKIITAAMLCLCCAAALITVFAAAEDYSVSPAAGFTIARYGDDMSGAAEIMGMTKKELERLCRENNVLFVAVNDDNTVQVRLSRYKTGLSEKIDDMSSLSDQLIEESFSDLASDYVKTTVGNTAYLRMSESLADSGGKYISDQYITVKNGYVYQLSVYRAESADAEVTDAFLQGIRINRTVIYSNKQKALVIAAIAVFLILIGFMIRGIIKDIKSEKGKSYDTQSK